ncbi:MAG: DUF177 domain-containing protein [Bacteroidota bacterium]|jgi:uncharacterized protein
MEKYQIQFSGLKPGLHNFEFTLDHSFFEHYSYSDIADCNIKIITEMEKDERMLVFRFDIFGTLGMVCDRCGDPLVVEISGKQNLVVKLSDHYEEESEDIRIIKESDGRVDISHFLYEYVCVMLPAHRVHGNDSKGKSLCNPDVIKRLEDPDLTHEPDPRWEVLRKLKEKE